MTLSEDIRAREDKSKKHGKKWQTRNGGTKGCARRLGKMEETKGQMPAWWITRQEKFERIKLISEPESFDCTCCSLSGLFLSWRASSIHFPSASYEVDNSDSSPRGHPTSSCRYFIFTVLFNDHGPRPIADGNTSVEFMYRARKIAGVSRVPEIREQPRVSSNFVPDVSIHTSNSRLYAGNLEFIDEMIKIVSLRLWLFSFFYSFLL